MPQINEAKMISMRVKTARLSFWGPDASAAEPTAEEFFGNVQPVIFHRDYISIAHKGGGETCIALLMKGTFTILSLRSGTMKIRCHQSPNCYLTSSEMTNLQSRQREAQQYLLGNAARRMGTIELYFSVERESWIVSGAKKAKPFGITDQLRRWIALYPPATSGQPAPQSNTGSPANLDDGSISADATRPSTVLEGVKAATESPRRQVSKDTRSASLPLPANLPPQTSLPRLTSLPPPNSDLHPAGSPFSASSQPPAKSIPASAVPPSIPPTSTEPQDPAALKRRIDEMIVLYDTIEDEETRLMAACKERKIKLWEEWRGAQPPPGSLKHPACIGPKYKELQAAYTNVEKEERDILARCRERKAQVWQEYSGIGFALKDLQHRANLKRKLDDMAAHYEDIEREEKEFRARCRERKEKLWEDLHRPDFEFKPLRHDRA
ncbi:MAG: hypothetical protein Q9192_005467 [Flavoplaca navasiana]